MTQRSTARWTAADELLRSLGRAGCTVAEPALARWEAVAAPARRELVRHDARTARPGRRSVAGGESVETRRNAFVSGARWAAARPAPPSSATAAGRQPLLHRCIVCASTRGRFRVASNSTYRCGQPAWPEIEHSIITRHFSQSATPPALLPRGAVDVHGTTRAEKKEAPLPPLPLPPVAPARVESYS